MSDSFFLKILATDKTLFEGKAKSLIFTAPDGEVQIMAHHEDVVIACAEGRIKIKADGEAEEMLGVVGIGFVNVEKNVVTMLTDFAHWQGDLEEARAKEAMERAKEELRQDKSIQEYNISRATIARAMLKLSHGNGSPLE